MAGSSHGHTPAAWTGVTISFIGFCIAGVFMVAANPLGFWAGIAVILLGGVVGARHEGRGPRHAEGVRGRRCGPGPAPARRRPPPAQPAARADVRLTPPSG